MLSTKSRADRNDHSRSAQTPPRYSLTPRFLLAVGLAIALVACAPATVTPGSGGSGGGSKGGSGGNNNGGSGGNNNGGSGGNNNGGSGGNNTGGSGGNSSGGSGGNSSGGSGGSNTGGTTVKGGSGGNSGGSGGGNGGSGGSNTGGTTVKGGSGGNAGGSGGTSAGGSGGTSAGGAGGTSAGGTSAGGTAGGGAGGGGAGGGSGGGGGTGSRPPGYFYTADWKVTKADWHGCAWTGKDCASNCPTGVTPVPNSTTTVDPVDFMSTKDGGPYQLKGKVGKAYEAVALMGFNINEAIDSSKGATQCKYDPALKDGPPTVTMPSGATGIAVNWSATTLPVTFRIQIQGVKGATDATNRWCATIKDTKGPSFIPFTDFNTTCWNTTGVKYNNEPIDAVAFLVPGTTSAESPFDITVVGFAPGTSAADAPGPAAACGTRTGTVGQSALQGDSTKDTDASTQRAVTDGKDCKKYIVNNNNWGKPSSSYQKVSFSGNSFVVDAMNGTGSDAPASFPSLYVGGNGQTLNGTFVTWDDTFPSKTPTSIGSMASAQSTFKWSGKSSGDFNAAYDIWFSKSIPTSGSYNDAISGFIMLWLYKPSSRQPIGNVVRQANIAGVDWDVWAGPRGNTSTGTDPAGRPVISYVAKSSTASFSGDLKAFFTDAVSKADSANGITQTFSSSWYLTDVFAGFEIWSGGAGLKCDEFTVAIK